MDRNDRQIINDHPSKKDKNIDRFSKEFNRSLRRALSECVVKEKLTSAKDKLFYLKLFATIYQPAMSVVFSSARSHGNIQKFISDLGFRMVIAVPIAYGLYNFIAREYYSGFSETNPRQGVELFFPPLRIDDVIIGKGYLDFKGRTLVRPQIEKQEK